MAKRILVPLDRTPLAESILPLVADLARGSGGAVRLLHVAPMPGNVRTKEGRIVVYADQEMDRLRTEGVEYLQALQASLQGIPVDSAVRFGEPVKEIQHEAAEFNADLVAVTTGSRSLLRRTLMGSVAERVLHDVRVPILLHHPGSA